MKRTFLNAMLPVAALLLLASCTDEEVDTPASRPIDFRAAITRGTSIDNSNLNSIRVTALRGGDVYFDQEEYTQAPGSTVFTSTKEYLWPSLDALEFWAYAPSNLNGSNGAEVVIGNDAQKRVANFKPTADIASHTDFVVAHGTGTRDKNETAGMPLTFEHKLAQVEVQAKSDNDLYTFVIEGVRVGKLAASGTYYFDTDKWTLDATAGQSTYKSENVPAVTLTSTAQSVMGADGNAMVIPQQLTAWDVDGDANNSKGGSYLSVKLTVKKTDNNFVLFPSANSTSAWAAIPIDTKLEAGKKYIFTLDFTHGGGYIDPDDPEPGKPVLGGPIKFTVKVSDWTPATEDKKMDTSK